MTLSPASIRKSTAGHSGRRPVEQLRIGAVADAEPNHNGRLSGSQAALGKIVTFRDNGSTILQGITPYLLILGVT